MFVVKQLHKNLYKTMRIEFFPQIFRNINTDFSVSKSSRAHTVSESVSDNLLDRRRVLCDSALVLSCDLE